MERLAIVATAVLCIFQPSCNGGRFDPSKVPPLNPPPSELLDTSQLISLHGYKPETYTVQTEDGYILPIYRILNKPGPPILLLMGLGVGPEIWVLHGPGYDLGFILSDMGYDVWLGTQRGNYGTAHISFNVSQPEFWDFSHDESGYFDLPAMIDIILSKSGYTKLYYAGASLGSTLFMVLCSERPQYEAAFAGSVHFGPAMWISRFDVFTQSTQIFLSSLKIALKAMEAFGGSSVYYRTPGFEHAIYSICNGQIASQACLWFLDFMAGFNPQNMASGWTAYSVALAGSGTSIRAVNHLIQLTVNGGTQKYDFGPYHNLKKYGTYAPPSYDLSKISSPTAIYYSKIDKLIRYPAMRIALSLIGNLKHSMAVPDPTYGHAEFVFGKDLYKLLYCDVVDFLDSISGINNSTKFYNVNILEENIEIKI